MTDRVATLSAQLLVDEGRRQWPYRDTRGFLTIGIGHNLSINGISSAVCDAILAEDIAAAAGSVSRVWAWADALPDAQWCVLVGLAFNMGIITLATFVQFLAAMERGDWTEAAAQLRASKWWNEVGERGPRTVARLTGAA